MVKEKRKIAIDNEAKKALKDAYAYIKNNSVQNADKIKVVYT